MNLPYAELGAMSNFSFLEGASHPQELVAQARHVGIAALGLADRNSLAGVVRAHKEAKRCGQRLLVGCRLGFTDDTELIVFPRDRAAYGRLCRLLSLGKSEVVPQATSAETASATILEFPTPPFLQKQEAFDATATVPASVVRMDSCLRGNDRGKAAEAPHIGKGETRLTFDQALSLGDGMIALVPAPLDPDAVFEERLRGWAKDWPDRLYLAAAPLWRGDDRARIASLAALAKRTGTPLVATNAVLYHHPDRRPLQDVLACVREKVTVDRAGYLLEAHAERHLKAPEEMARLFRGHEDAIARTVEIVEACTFSLTELEYQYPDEPVPPGWKGRTPLGPSYL